MDPITHYFITRKLVGSKPTIILAGLIADTPFYLTYPPWLVVTDQLRDALATNTWPKPPAWMTTLHHIFHSFPVLGILALLHRVVQGQWSSPSLAAWCVHILIDLPTHSRRQWAPQFLWPLSPMTINGMSWAELTFAIITAVRRHYTIAIQQDEDGE